MATTAGFRHRLKRRHLDPDADYMPENKRHLSERMAQEMGVLKLDDHNNINNIPVPIPSVSSPQSPYSTSPPSYTPPPSPSSQPTSPFSFSQRFTPQNFQQQMQQMNQINNPVHQFQLQQQLQQHHIMQQRQLLNPSSPPLSPITYEHPPKPDSPVKALTIYQPFQFSNPPKQKLDPDEDEDIEKDDEKLPTYVVNIPELEKKATPEPFLPLPEDKSRALILYSAPSEVIQNSINKPIKKEQEKESNTPPMDVMEDVDTMIPTNFTLPINTINNYNNNHPLFPISTTSAFTPFSSSISPNANFAYSPSEDSMVD